MTDKPKPQADKFRDLARELGCDEDEEAFKAKLREIARNKPTPSDVKPHKDKDSE